MSYASQLPASARRLHQGGRIGWQPAAYSGSVWYSVTKPDLQAFMNVAFASLETVNGSTHRYVPLRHPDYPLGLIASNADIELVGWSTAAADYSHAIVRLDFYSPPFGINGAGAFLTVEVRSGSEVVTVPGWALSVGGVAINQDAGVPVQVMQFLVSRFQVPTDNSGAYAPLLNHTNNAPLTVGSLTAAAGYFLFSDASTSIQATIGNVVTYQESLAITYRSPPWGYVMTPSSGWAGPAKFPDGSDQCPQADLSVLFTL